MELNQTNKALPSVLASNTGGETRLYASKGGKRRTNKKKGGKKSRKARRARRTCF